MTEERVNRESISVKPLTTFQRVIYGIAAYGVGSATAVVEGPVIFHYSDELGVSTKYLAIVNFIVGVATIFASLLIGGISDRSKARYRRKPYIAVLMFVYAAGLFFRYGAFTTSEAAPFYYAVTMLVQMCGNVAIGVVQGAWAVELANEGTDRANFFAVCGVVGVFGIFFGLGLSAAPLVFGGLFLAVVALVSNSLCLWCIDEKTPLSKRSFIPTVTNLKSVFWNRQFVVYISSMLFIYFINTVPTLYLFFLTYVMDQSEDAATLSYLLSVGGFVIMGFFAMPLAPRLIKQYGKIVVGDATLKSMVVLGTIMFIGSFVHPAVVIAVFSVVGFSAALAGTVFSIMMADIVDYDELLTGMKRGASYGGVSGPANTFISIAGSSIPLALMSAFNFEAPDPDADDLADDRAQNGYSSAGSTGVLRVYCTLFIALCSYLAMLVLRMYKIDNVAHDEILISIHKRNVAAATSNGIDPINDEFDEPARTSDTRDSLVEDEVPVIKVDVNLGSVHNPVTGKLVMPAPYITVEQTISKVIDNRSIMAPSLVALDEVQRNDLRLLGYYFPGMLNLCVDNDDIQVILVIGFVRWWFFLAVTLVAVWQSVVSLIAEKEFPTYLVVVSTTVYVIFFIWEVLYLKGYRLLRSMKSNPDRPLQQYLEVIHSELEALEAKESATGDTQEDTEGNLLRSRGALLFTTPRAGLRTESAKVMLVVLASLALAVLAVQLS